MVRAKQIARWLWVPVVLVFVYVGWVMYSRWAGNRRLEAEAANARVLEDKKVLEKLGSGLKVLMFYANPPVVRRGSATLLCYGVTNATKVRIEPQVEGVGPTLSRCVEIKPAQDTSYTLIAEDDSGGQAKSFVDVKVQ